MHDEIEDISLRDLAQKLWQRRGLIAVITTLATAVAIATAFLLPEKFQASVVLSPVTSEADVGKLGGAGALLSQFGDIAGVSGLGGSGSSKKAEAVATLQSSALTESFIKEKNLLPVLFSDKWNAEAKSWKEADPMRTPTVWKGELKFREDVRTVTEDKKSGLVTLTITWTDPNLAAEWANELVLRTNSTLRSRAIAESRRNLAYLSDQISKTSIVELQRAIYGLTESEIKKVMLAEGNDEYAFKILDPARCPERRSSPKRTMIVIAGLFIGLIIAFLLALVLPTRHQ